jgi:hypothetical protein
VVKHLKFILIPLILLIGVVLYFTFNISYQKSIEAKFYFSIGEYTTAYILADEALKIREYNNMAFSIKTKSSLVIEFINFNQESKEFFIKIDKIIYSYNVVPRPEKIRIKMICEIMLEKYKKLSFSLVEDEDIKEKAKYNFTKFDTIYKKVKESL